MLTEKHARPRVKAVRDNRLSVQYLKADSDDWLDAAARLLGLFRGHVGKTREELQEQKSAALGESAAHAVHEGLTKLLEDRCEFEVSSGAPPADIRDALFTLAARQRRDREFDRATAVASAAESLSITTDDVEQNMFADLKAAQRLIKFKDITAERLVRRYNEALAQAVLMRATRVEVRILNETPARYRQLFRTIKFHRLMCEVEPFEGDGYRITLDGPLSLFSATQRYGFQLACFLPHLLQCREFELRAVVKWGLQKKEKLFFLTHEDGLESHLPDYASHTPPELEMFAEQFRKSAKGWELHPETALLPLGRGVWVPDFQLVRPATGEVVYLEVLGFWRRADVDKHLRNLREHAPGPFVLAASEAYHSGESPPDDLAAAVYRFKRQPIVGEVIARAEAALAGPQ